MAKVPFDYFQAVSLFNSIIGGFNKPPKPKMLDKKTDDFRVVLMQEELNEYIDATTVEDKFDALIDLVYVALGTAYLMGLPFEDGFKEVHYANMNKVRATKESDSKRESKLDIVKPPGWVAPNLKQLLERLCR
jgi:predicted HAD superfamily Cof-like phosphohydrolase